MARGEFAVLVRHFFERFFDRESLSPNADQEGKLAQILGLLAAPGAFFVILLLPLSPQGWGLAGIRYYFVSFSLSAMGILMVLEWDALFPDKRDYLVLTPLPLPLWKLFAAKMAALSLLLGLFLADINFFAVLFWPGVDMRHDATSVMAAHAAVVAAAGIFSALSVAAIQGILAMVFSGALYRRISVIVQAALMSVFVALLFLTPFTTGVAPELVRTDSPALRWFPGYWFMGLYERLAPVAGGARLANLGAMATGGLACAAAVFILTYLPGYRRHARRVLSSDIPQGNVHGALLSMTSMGGRIVLCDPVQRGVFHFISATITRSPKHRLFLAGYAGVGIALAVLNLRNGPEGVLQLPLTLAFILVSGLRACFNVPAELPANWSFQMTDSDSLRSCLNGTRKWVLLCAIAPLTIALAPVEFVNFPWDAALLHCAFGLTMAVLLMEVLLLGFRKVPFTCSYRPGRVNFIGLSAVYVFGFTAYSRIMASFESWLTRAPWAACAFFAAAVLAYALVSHLRGKKLAECPGLDFHDAADPAVRTLGVFQG